GDGGIQAETVSGLKLQGLATHTTARLPGPRLSFRARPTPSLPDPLRSILRGTAHRRPGRDHAAPATLRRPSALPAATLLPAGLPASEAVRRQVPARTGQVRALSRQPSLRGRAGQVGRPHPRTRLDPARGRRLEALVH